MKKTILILVGFGVLYAGPTDTDSADYYYNKGYSEGKIVGYRKGFEAGKKEALKQLKRRLNEIKAMEAGKYLVKEHKITAPKLYQVKQEDGSIKVVVKGCQLEKELTPEEIMMLPKVNNIVGSDALSYSTKNDKKAISDSVYLPGVDTKSEIPHSPDEANRVTYLYLPNTEYYKKLLDSAGKPYAISYDGKIKVLFESNRDKNIFVKEYDLNPGEDYK